MKWLAPTLNRRWHEKSLAVRVGLALVEAVAALPAPERLQARVGIATGLVVVGDLAGASPEHEVVGEAPNLAARLQALAAPDSVLIASTTRRLVGATFALDPVGSLRLKGWPSPLPVWRVTGENPSGEAVVHSNGPKWHWTCQ